MKCSAVANSGPHSAKTDVQGIRTPSRAKRRSRRLPTNVPVPVDPQFVDMFVRFGWQRVERMWGKRRVATWAAVVGKRDMIRARREFLARRKGNGGGE